MAEKQWKKRHRKIDCDSCLKYASNHLLKTCVCQNCHIQGDKVCFETNQLNCQQISMQSHVTTAENPIIVCKTEKM